MKGLRIGIRAGIERKWVGDDSAEGPGGRAAKVDPLKVSSTSRRRFGGRKGLVRCRYAAAWGASLGRGRNIKKKERSRVSGTGKGLSRVRYEG